MYRIARQQGRRGFTLVEVLIVVVILGILAATVMPQFTAANNDAKESALVQNLQVLRGQIELFKFQHLGKYPGHGSTATADFKNAMLLSSDAAGVTGAIGTKPLGPYIVGQFPANPFTGGRGVMIVADVPGTAVDEAALDGTEKVGWIYDPATGLIKSNTTGNAANGTPLHQL